ncbi:hypothetical protein AB8989_08140 [Yersinia hibernica]|uniref:Arsenate reductase n=1 Tax=Yersinia hibernica TaxID=2339259 RepID=A0ABX5R6V9_9GAMM|nr:hypothetical protein [Yersinia hibernica]QAX80910.1 hypothetical protein D5F51_21730 [Yersinia hibernica]
MNNITIYHNPACGTSRNTLEMIRNSVEEPSIILYLETPPVLDILPNIQQGAFTKENGEKVVDESGQRVK